MSIGRWWADSAVLDLELLEIESLGRRFTWSRELSTPTLVPLDQVFCLASWEELFQDSLLQSTAAGISDHCPLTLGLRDNAHGTRRFHFECYWSDMYGRNSQQPGWRPWSPWNAWPPSSRTWPMPFSNGVSGPLVTSPPSYIKHWNCYTGWKSH